MSFGFSVGDFLAGAELAYTLYAALSDAHGAASEYRQLGKELLVVHRVLLHVDQLRAANQLAQATLNALLFSVNTTNEAIETFLAQYETYQSSLGPDGPKNLVKDAFKKGKWAIQMPDKVHDLRGKLAMMLAAINCLVSISCYYNTGYNPQCSAEVKINTQSPREPYQWKTDSQKPIPIEAFIYPDEHQFSNDFRRVRESDSFFRPGQIFAAEITSTLLFHDEPCITDIDFSALPLAPVSELDTKELQGRANRLAQIHNLPLQQMTLYCEELPQDPDQVVCLLCQSINLPFSFTYTKDHWASYHFRFIHWEYYFSMLPDDSSMLSSLTTMILPLWTWDHLIPFSKLKQPGPDARFSAEAWIRLDQIRKDGPIMTDDSIARDIKKSSIPINQGRKRGPVLIRRFVVVRQGKDRCLCLGIHTFARHGCGSQPDQELFSILHSSKIPPPPMPDETGIVLSPVRMKAEHPSRALPRTARIHYGRVYEISHALFVQSIGLIHDSSMETLLDQFEETMNRRCEQESTNKKAVSLDEPKAEPVDQTIASSIRGEIRGMPGLSVPLRINKVMRDEEE